MLEVSSWNATEVIKTDVLRLFRLYTYHVLQVCRSDVSKGNKRHELQGKVAGLKDYVELFHIIAFKLVGDNIDKNIHPRYQTIKKQTQSLHYFNCYEVLHRVDFLFTVTTPILWMSKT